MPASDLYSNPHDSNNAVGLAEQCVEILPERLRKPLSTFIAKFLSQYSSGDERQNELIDCIEDAVEEIPREEDICIHVAFAEHFEPKLPDSYKQPSLLPAVAELYSHYPLHFLHWFHNIVYQYDVKANWATRRDARVISGAVRDAITNKYIFCNDKGELDHKSWVACKVAAVVLTTLVQDFDNQLCNSEGKEKRYFVELLEQLGRNANMLEVIDFVFVSLKSSVDKYSLMDGSRLPADAGELVNELEKSWVALKGSSSWQLRGTWEVSNEQ